ncbi:FAD linked oxidase domain protein [Cellulomonas flavigena DSM 20109]|uniref:FAD linked oxidase domain protein n=1 Tax=Cellulomonas flavigena (strain ATCC 482 / DSM 20109 / BCRC 11376 / JCM 18109 / NBRC 3775 / NCIMB 8073 / NRS 134) TaxID=446466 RepID=D5UKM0_CELFN|nr:FAD-binding protein [Cellulomonas flavigena]ADG73838.1 FAD linked oxidase domain protein [Cellulomonas flavigena DSM 20109]
MTDALTTWAGSHTFRGGPVVRPRTVEEVADVVAGARHVRALGSRHSFHDLADSPGTLVALDRLEVPTVIDPDAGTVTVGAGVRYGELAQDLHAAGWALHTMASLPHIAVAGTVATATHGSGDTAPNLSSAVRGLEIVGAGGEVRTLGPDDPELAGSVVALGALGVVTRVTLAVQPTFDVAQEVWLDLPWTTALDRFDALTSSAYSVSLFTDWTGDAVKQVWRKHRVDGDAWTLPGPGEVLAGARPAPGPQHPVPGPDPVACTQQGGVPGAWHERLPHFRLDFTPSAGAELQSEWLVPRAHATAAIDALRGIGHVTSPLLLVSEIRTVAGDDLWLSTAHGGDHVALHFTWKPLRAEVEAALPVIAAALAPFAARPHWGKLFAADAATLRGLYPRWDDQLALIARRDPDGIFANDFLRRVGLRPA